MANPARIRSTMAIVEQICRGHPVSYATLLENGLTPAQVRSAVRSGALTSLRRGIFIGSVGWQAALPEERHHILAHAALIAYPDTFLSHESAARLHGLPDIGDRQAKEADDVRVHITRAGLSRHEAWLSVHGCDTPPEHVGDTHGFPATDLIRTSIELGASRSLRRTAVFIDAAMRRFIINGGPEAAARHAAIDPVRRALAREAWTEALTPYAGRRWVTRARRAVELAEPASESPLESLSAHCHRREWIGRSEVRRPCPGR